MNIQLNVHSKSAISHGAEDEAMKVIVTCCARLHMGFFDLNGSTGRMFGSLGLGIDAPCTQIEIAKSEKTKIEVISGDCASENIEEIVNSFKIAQHVSVKVNQSIPEHTGLGSGTQMALAVGAGLNRLFNLGLTVPQIAAVTQRGSRSGIGIGTFEQGGLVIDGGRGNAKNKAKAPPPIIARHDFPQEWTILLILDNAEQGAHGEHELLAFDALPKASLATAQILAHSVLMQALPALVERDYAAFSNAIYKLQRATGEYFAPAQGGIFKSKNVAEVLNYLYQNNVLCAGQSSWGPTGFAVFKDDLSANATLMLLQQQFSSSSNISFQLVRGKNTGATIQLG